MARHGPSPDFVREFSESMPHAYRYAFGADAIVEHARLSASRGGALAAVGRFSSRRDVGDPICVVADDRPGLLATISGALVLHELEVVHAEAYTRKTSAAQYEAVDVFWVSPMGAAPQGKVGDDKIEALRQTLLQLLEGSIDSRRIRRSLSMRPGPHAQETRVRFIEGQEGELCTLEVETWNRSGLLLALADALYRQQVQIVRSEVRTDGDRVRDRFSVVELDGGPIGNERRLQIQVAVLSAIEPSADLDID